MIGCRMQSRAGRWIPAGTGGRMVRTFFAGACMALTAAGGCARFNVLPPTIVDASGRPASRAAEPTHSQPAWEPAVAERPNWQTQGGETASEAVAQSASSPPAGYGWEPRAAYDDAANGQAPGVTQWQPLYTGDQNGSVAYGNQAAPSVQQAAATPQWNVRENPSQSQRITTQPGVQQNAAGAYSQQNRPRVTQVLENPNAMRSAASTTGNGMPYGEYADPSWAVRQNPDAIGFSDTGNFAVTNPAGQQRPTASAPQVSNVWVTEPNPPSSVATSQGPAETALNPQTTYSSAGQQRTMLPDPTRPALKQIEPTSALNPESIPAVNEQRAQRSEMGMEKPAADAMTQPSSVRSAEAIPAPMPEWAAEPTPAPQPRDPLMAAMERLEQMVQQHPEDRVSQLTLRLFYLNHGMEEKALSLLPDLPSAPQSETIAMARAIAMTQKAQDSQNQNNPLYANQALEALEHWETEVARKADFQVAHFELCRTGSVKGFGQYEPLDAQVLTSGQAQTVQIYCELKNFSSQKQADGNFLSKVAVEISLVDRSYREIMSLPRGEIPDTSRNQRHDFFFSGPVSLPSLPPGEYELVVKVEDVLANKTSLPARYKFTVKK